MNNNRKLETGKIHLYAGAGKGKTTAAIGLTVRASGYGLKVLFIQFLKAGDSSEIKVLQKLPNLKVLTGMPTDKFTIGMNDQEKSATKIRCEDYFEQATNLVNQGKVDVLVLDEILDAVSTGMVNEQQLLDFLKTKPQQVEVILTGRNPSQDLVELVDYFSEICARKHPYNTEKLLAREGIEY